MTSAAQFDTCDLWKESTNFFAKICVIERPKTVILAETFIFTVHRSCNSLSSGIVKAMFLQKHRGWIGSTAKLFLRHPMN